MYKENDKLRKLSRELIYRYVITNRHHSESSIDKIDCEKFSIARVYRLHIRTLGIYNR